MKKRFVGLKNYFLNGFSPVVRFLILSDVMIVGAGGLLGPVFALFIEDYIEGGNEAVAGIAASIFLFTKSLLQIPVAAIIDKIRGEKDDYRFMSIFSVLMAVIPIFYLFVHKPWHLYLVQFFFGLFTAFTFPSYMALFTRHTDKGKEGIEWGVYFTLTDLCSALMSGLGGLLAAAYGFQSVIIVTVVASLIGAFLLFPIKAYLRTK